MGTEQMSDKDLLAMTADIVAAHVSNNQVDMADLPQLMEQVYQSLSGLGSDTMGMTQANPAVAIDDSITPDYLICLEDGKKLKMLKRHLKTVYDMTPEQYRARWGLAPDYPMVAPNYAKHRSRLAREIGLGTRTRKSATS